VSATIGPLAENGGPTETIALLAGSLGIDAANEAAAPDVDQRGARRPFGLHADIGAYEAQVSGSAGVLQFSPTNYSVSETAGNITLTLYRAGGTDGAASAQFSTGDGTALAGQNYAATNGTLGFSDGQQSGQIVVTILNAPGQFDNVNFTVTFYNPSGASLENRTATVTVLGAETGIAFATNSDLVDIAAGYASVMLELTGNTNNGASVNFATSDGTAMAGRDYTAVDSTINFAPGQTLTNVSIPIFSSGSPGPNKTVNLTLSDPNGASLLSPSTAVLTIVNTNVGQPGALTLQNATYYLSDAAPLGIITVLRNNGSNGPVSLVYATSDGTAKAGVDYTATSGTLKFADQQTIADIAVPIVFENTNGQKTFNITLSAPGGGATLGEITTAGVLISYGAQTLSNPTEAAFRHAVLTEAKVTFSTDANITLTSPLAIPYGLVIDGTGHQVTISGGKAVQIFSIDSGVNLTLSNLTLTGGYSIGAAGSSSGDAPGNGGPAFAGAVYNSAGVLTAVDCVLSNNEAIGGRGGNGHFPVPAGVGGPGSGGCIYNANGQVFATNCILTGNAALGGAPGTNNSGYTPQGLNGSGGAIYSSGGSVLLVNCMIVNNDAAPGWGLYDQESSYTAGSAYGGGIYNAGGMLTILGSDLSSNLSALVAPEYYSPAFGGGIYQSSGSLSMANCLIQGNTSHGGDGFFYGGLNYATDGLAEGGGICLAGGSASISNSTFAGNMASGGENGSAYGGAIYNAASLQAVNCTVAGNVLTGGVVVLGSGSGDDAGGGGLCNAGLGFAVLTELTLANNNVQAGSGGQSGEPATASGGGIESTNAASLVLRNTILCSNSPSDFSGLLEDDGNNLASDSSPPFTAPGSIEGVDPLLGPLTNNGGPTPTMALLPGSPAIGAANPAYVTATDQRGVLRPQGPSADIGAFEVGTLPSILNFAGASNNIYSVTFSGAPDQQVEIQSSSDLINWSPYLTNNPGMSGVFQFNITNQPGPHAAFFRALIQ
jgi:hypothetical protein